MKKPSIMKNFTKSMTAVAIMLSAASGSHAANHLNIIGSATPGEWSIDEGLLMQPTEEENEFSCVAYLKADQGFKFISGPDYSDASWQYLNTSDDPYTISTLAQGGEGVADQQFMVKEDANYKIVCNLNDMTVSVTKFEYQENPIRFNGMWIVGAISPEGWNCGAGLAMQWSGEENPFQFEYEGEIADTGDNGEFKICTNIYNNSWGGPWYHPGVDADGAVDYNQMTLDDTDDRKWAIDEPGKYQIEANTLDNTFKITKILPAAIEEIESDEQGEAVYYNLQGIIVDKPVSGVYVKKAGNKVSKVIF